MISDKQIWEEPISISETKDELPVFPAHCFPTAVGEYVTALSENTQTSVDMAAVVALGILAVAAQRYYRIEGNSGYYEPLNLYVLLVAEPGERKSSIMQSFVRFLNDYEEKIMSASMRMTVPRKHLHRCWQRMTVLWLSFLQKGAFLILLPADIPVRK